MAEAGRRKTPLNLHGVFCCRNWLNCPLHGVDNAQLLCQPAWLNLLSLSSPPLKHWDGPIQLYFVAGIQVTWTPDTVACAEGGGFPLQGTQHCTSGLQCTGMDSMLAIPFHSLGKTTDWINSNYVLLLFKLFFLLNSERNLSNHVGTFVFQATVKSGVKSRRWQCPVLPGFTVLAKVGWRPPLLLIMRETKRLYGFVDWRHCTRAQSIFLPAARN